MQLKIPSHYRHGYLYRIGGKVHLSPQARKRLPGFDPMTLFTIIDLWTTHGEKFMTVRSKNYLLHLRIEEVVPAVISSNWQALPTLDPIERKEDTSR